MTSPLRWGILGVSELVGRKAVLPALQQSPMAVIQAIGSRDLGRALRVAKGVRAGVLSVNSNASVHTEAPFGGYKMSGMGRELGMHALELYTELKNVFVDLR